MGHIPAKPLRADRFFEALSLQTNDLFVFDRPTRPVALLSLPTAQGGIGEPSRFEPNTTLFPHRPQKLEVIENRPDLVSLFPDGAGFLRTPAGIFIHGMKELSSENRALVLVHFINRESVVKIQRQRQMKRRDVEAVLAATLSGMRTALRFRGVRAVSGVICASSHGSKSERFH